MRLWSKLDLELGINSVSDSKIVSIQKEGQSWREALCSHGILQWDSERKWRSYIDMSLKRMKIFVCQRNDHHVHRSNCASFFIASCWCTILLSKHGDKFMEAGEGEHNQHDVEIFLIKKWRHRIIDIDYINERIITVAIMKSSTYQTYECILPSLGIYGHDIEKMYETIGKTHDTLQKVHFSLMEQTSIQNWDLHKKQNA